MIDDESAVRRRSAMRSFLRAEDSSPPSVHMKVRIAAQRWRSPLRSISDSHYVVVRVARSHHTLTTSLPQGEVPDFGESGYGMTIAHGIGTAGEAASRLAVATLVQLVIDFGRWNVRVNELLADEVADRAERFYRAIDLILLRASKELPGSLQTTLTAAYSAGNELFLAHVGRSRAYMFRDGALMQLTRDHTSAGTDVAVANMAPAALESPPVATQMLGRRGPGSPRVDVERVGLLDGDLVLLCTSGLTDVVDDVRVADALRQNFTLNDTCRALVSDAISSGAKDDVTVLIARYRTCAEPTSERDVALEP